MRIALGRSVALVSHRPRHAEVDQEHTTGFEPNNQILAAWLDGPRRARIEDLDTVEPPADEDGLEANSNRLDLGQLGHGASLAAALQRRSSGDWRKLCPAAQQEFRQALLTRGSRG